MAKSTFTKTTNKPPNRTALASRGFLPGIFFAAAHPPPHQHARKRLVFKQRDPGKTRPSPHGTHEKGRLSSRPANSPLRGKLSVLERRFVRYGQLLATLGTTCCQHLATVRRSHTSAETVLVDSLPARGLVSSLHCHSYLIFIVSDIFTDCKSTTKKRFAKIFGENISKGPEIARLFVASALLKILAPWKCSNKFGIPLGLFVSLHIHGCG